MNCTTKLSVAGMALAFAAFITGCMMADHAMTNADAVPTAQAHPALVPISDVNESKPVFRAEFVTAPAEVKAGEPVTLSFTIRDAKGASVRQMQIVHEKPMHLLVVSSDLAEFTHIHPEPQPDGTFKIAHTFLNGGAYKLYADFTPQGASQVIESVDLNVIGNARPRVALVEDKTMTKVVDGLRVTMKPDKTLRAADELMLNFAVADAKSGKPAIDLQPYLGALAHFVIISEDTTDFLHAHPMTKEEMNGMRAMSGMDHAASPHSHGAREMSDRAETRAANSPSEVAAHTTFPRAGLYKVWAQFQRSGRVITVPFVLRVAANQDAPAISANNTTNDASNVPAGAVRVTVSSTGYEPSRIEAKRGQPIVLAFYRADANNCGSEVIFPSLNVRRKLPVGQTVIVEVTPQESGDLAFACGMNMMRGALIVQ